jgi:hypothetical protein
MHVPESATYGVRLMSVNVLDHSRMYTFLCGMALGPCQLIGPFWVRCLPAPHSTLYTSCLVSAHSYHIRPGDDCHPDTIRSHYRVNHCYGGQLELESIYYY